MNGVPDLAAVRAWVQVPATAISDEDLTRIRAAELSLQARLCRLPDDPDADGNPGEYPQELASSLLRRCQRQIAVRALPLGVLGVEGSEYGPLSVSKTDAEIARLEASYRIVVVA